MGGGRAVMGRVGWRERLSSWNLFMLIGTGGYVASLLMQAVGGGFGPFSGWYAARHSMGMFMSLVGACVTTPGEVVEAIANSSAKDLGALWDSVAWIGNLAWPAAWLCRLSPPYSRRSQRLGRWMSVVAMVTIWSGVGMREWCGGYWMWASTSVLAFMAAWWGPRRAVRAGRCQRCGYELGGADVCSECGTEAVSS